MRSTFRKTLKPTTSMKRRTQWQLSAAAAASLPYLLGVRAGRYQCCSWALFELVFEICTRYYVKLRTQRSSAKIISMNLCILLIIVQACTMPVVQVATTQIKSVTFSQTNVNYVPLTAAARIRPGPFTIFLVEPTTMSHSHQSTR